MHRDTQRALALINNQGITEQMAKRLNSPVLYRDLPKQLAAANEPVRRMVSAIATNLTRTDLSVAAFVELLIEKGVFTQDEFNNKEVEVTQRFAEAMSLAQEQAQEEAGDKKVERLVEPVGVLTEAPESESVPRSRLVEG